MKYFIRAIVGGLAGTIVMTLMMYFEAPIMTGETTDIAERLGAMPGNS